MVLNENATLFLFWIINRFLKISILNRLLLSSWLELVILFLCYDFKLGVSPKYAIQMGRWVYTIYWNNMVKINHINHRRPPNIISSLSTFFENKRDCVFLLLVKLFPNLYFNEMDFSVLKDFFISINYTYCDQSFHNCRNFENLIHNG